MLHHVSGFRECSAYYGNNGSLMRHERRKGGAALSKAVGLVLLVYLAVKQRQKLCKLKFFLHGRSVRP